MKRIISIMVLIGILVTFSMSANAGQCTLNSGAYIAHSKASIVKAYNYVFNGRWSMLNVMLSNGELKRINGSYNINSIEVNDKYVKFSIKVAPSKEIWTLKMFTNCQ